MIKYGECLFCNVPLFYYQQKVCGKHRKEFLHKYYLKVLKKKRKKMYENYPEKINERKEQSKKWRKANRKRCKACNILISYNAIHCKPCSHKYTT